MAQQEGLRDLLPSGTIVALDTSVFIYHFEGNPSYTPITLHLFDRIAQGELQAITSTLTITELLTGPLRAGEEEMAAHYRAILRSFPNLSLIPVGEEAAASAAELRARHGLPTPDALHVACALQGGATTFISNDNAFRRVSEVRVIILDDLSDSTASSRA